MSYFGIDGDHEPFSDTIRAGLAKYWNDKGLTDTHGFTPFFSSEGGVGIGGAGNVAEAAEHDEAVEKSNAEVTVNVTEGNIGHTERTGSLHGSVHRIQNIRIDISADNSIVDNMIRLATVRDMVDDYIHETNFKTKTWNKSRDGLKSAITGLYDYPMDWERISTDSDEEGKGVTIQWSGVISVQYIRDYSSEE